MLHQIFDNNLVGNKQSCIKAEKPVYIGLCILELIKVLMYKIHYDNIKNKYDSNSKLLSADTNSLMQEIITEDVYEDLSSNEEMFDFSSCSTQSKYYYDSKKLVIVKMKDETRGAATEKFFGMRPKMYSFLIYENREHGKAKTVNRNVTTNIKMHCSKINV